MGSYSSSVNQSSTNYQNTPIAQEDVENPINLINATGNKIGSTEVTNGSIINTTNLLDGGAVKDAFAFGSKAVQLVADLTAKSNQSILDASTKAVTAIKDNADPESAADWTQNKTFLYAAGAVLVAYFYFKKG